MHKHNFDGITLQLSFKEKNKIYSNINSILSYFLMEWTEPKYLIIIWFKFGENLVWIFGYDIRLPNICSAIQFSQFKLN